MGQTISRFTEWFGSNTSLTLSTPDFNSTKFPVQNTCHGANLSPLLAWSNIPESTTYLAIIIDDPDSIRLAGTTNIFVHWNLFNIPASISSIGKGLSADYFDVGKNSRGIRGYAGPCPPADQTHQYRIALFALKNKVTNPNILNFQQTIENFETLEKGNIVDSKIIVRSYI